jgi:kinesin family member 4
MAASDCVQVAVRVRPFIASEMSRGCVQVLEKLSSQQLKVTGASNSNNNFSFNNLFMPDDDQDTVYDKSVKPFIDNLFEGYNVTILAYG